MIFVMVLANIGYWYTLYGIANSCSKLLNDFQLFESQQTIFLILSSLFIRSTEASCCAKINVRYISGATHFFKYSKIIFSDLHNDSTFPQ